jgi:beta-barrel assembly-enhancing protease
VNCHPAEGYALPLLILIIILFFLFNSSVLPGLGGWLGGKSRKPYRQAKWVWSSMAGTEDESIRAEQEYGEECARAFATQFSDKVSRTDQELVNSIGAKLADAVKDPRRKFRIEVAASAAANAYALPGGFIFITQSLLDLCGRDKDEIAFFLGHEIGHVIRGHARDRLTATTFFNAVMSRLPAAGRLLRTLMSRGYSQLQELEADQEAIRLTSAAGFNAQTSVAALKRLLQVAPNPSGLAEYLSSHPPISERVRELEKSLSACQSHCL